MLTLLAATVLLEIILYGFKPIWPIRRPVAVITAGLISFTTGGLLAEGLGVLHITALALSSARVFNLLRIIEGRMHAAYLLRATRRTGLIFSLTQLIVLVLLNRGIALNYSQLLMPFLWAQLVVAVLLVLLVVFSLKNTYKTKHQPHIEYYADKELPTVSVLIPARNETKDLEDCLRSLLASDYPKLEVIVLDDCSHDKTSEIIRGFAQDGVRFIRGSDPAERWLAKNMAYERLREEASGELLLFSGVDVRFGAHSVRALVTTLLNRKKNMVSVMPRRLNSTVLSAFIQPMRYWWELALPRRLFNRPPVLSTCWLARADALKQLGGFAAVSHAIIPEIYFSRELVKQGDSYSFVRSDEVLDIQTVKNPAEQRETAIRVRYPQVRRRPENALLLVLFTWPVSVSGIRFYADHFYSNLDTAIELSHTDIDPCRDSEH
jgi:glycosyltransferase involved in cell wall biosynthesis